MRLMQKTPIVGLKNLKFKITFQTLAPNKILYFPSNLCLVRSFFLFPSLSRGGGAGPRNYHTTQFLLCIADPFHLIPHSYMHIWWQYNPSLRIYVFICPCFFPLSLHVAEENQHSGCKPLTKLAKIIWENVWLLSSLVFSGLQ